MTAQLRARLLLLLRIVVTAVTLFLVFRQLDLGKMGQVLAGTRSSDVLLGIGCLFAALSASALRWHWILRRFGGSRKLTPCFRVYAISLFFNQLLPTSIGGDAYRAIAARSLGVRPQPAIESVVIDRTLALLTQLALVVALVPFTTLAHAAPPTSQLIFYIFAIALAVLAFVALFGARAWRRIPGTLRRSIVRLRRLATDPLFLSGVILLSLTTHALVALSLWWMTPLAGSPKDLVDVLFLSGWIVLVTALPISVGGWGLREGGVVAGLLLLGVGGEVATSAALLWGLAHLCIAIPGGLLSILPVGRNRTDPDPGIRLIDDESH